MVFRPNISDSALPIVRQKVNAGNSKFRNFVSEGGAGSRFRHLPPPGGSGCPLVLGARHTGRGHDCGAAQCNRPRSCRYPTPVAVQARVAGRQASGPRLRQGGGRGAEAVTAPGPGAAPTAAERPPAPAAGHDAADRSEARNCPSPSRCQRRSAFREVGPSLP